MSFILASIIATVLYFHQADETSHVDCGVRTFMSLDIAAELEVFIGFINHCNASVREDLLVSQEGAKGVFCCCDDDCCLGDSVVLQVKGVSGSNCASNPSPTAKYSIVPSHTPSIAEIKNCYHYYMK